MWQDQITLCNRAAASILGQASAEIVGRKLEEIIPTFVSEIQPHMNSVRENDQPIVGLELSQILPIRGNVDWRLNLSPLKDAGQKTQGVAIVLDDLTERKKLEAQRKLFERMVSPAVINQLDPNSLQLGGKRTDITVLFADVRGFTSFSESQEPEQLVSILNRYLGAMAEVRAFGGRHHRQVHGRCDHVLVQRSRAAKGSHLARCESRAGNSRSIRRII